MIRSMADSMLAAGSARRLALLAAVTILTVVMAVFAVATQRQSFTSHFEPRPVFPDLADRVNEAAKVVVESRRSKVTVVREAAAGAAGGPDGEAVWRVQEKAGHPAKADMVKRTVVGLADLELAEPRTARPEWHQHLGLRAPEDDGAGVRVAVYDANGEVMVALIAGKLEGSRDIDGRGSIYVRRDGEDQSYVARGAFNLEQQPVAWLEAEVLDLRPGRVARVEVAPPDGPAYVVVRADDAAAGEAGQAEPAYRIRDLDPALRPTTDYAVTGIGNALTGLVLADVVPAGEVTFATPVVSRFVTDDGLAVVATAEKLGDRYYAVFTAQALADADASVRAEAARLAARLAPFAYQLSTFDGADLTRTLDTLTEPVPPAGDGGAADPGTDD